MTSDGYLGYLEGMYGPEDEYLATIREQAREAGLPSIQVPHELGRHLQFFVRSSGARRILEVGTLFGYSAILMARALPRDGQLLTLEVDSKHASFARENIGGAKLSPHVEIREGPALDSLDSLLGEFFDLIFIDANKDSYPTYLERSLELTHKGSLILADNVWFRGEVEQPSSPESRALVEFTRAITSNPRLATTIIPHSNGNDAVSVSAVLHD